MSKPVIYIASDHRGVALKSLFVSLLREEGFKTHDLGPDSEERCDASDFAVRLAGALGEDEHAKGVLICGTGQAMAMTANRYRHIRAALCTNSTMARLAREHNDANVLVLGAHIIGVEVAQECLDVFLKTKHLGGRYAARVQMLTDLGGL
ncbi:MAG: ribose 5-phosphate isomerase B [Alphaproteobacteria bacterium]|nr:ribose 5-phosphate isomerase B [Alphaproteobacteria bacterium]